MLPWDSSYMQIGPLNQPPLYLIVFVIHLFVILNCPWCTGNIYNNIRIVLINTPLRHNDNGSRSGCLTIRNAINNFLPTHGMYFLLYT